MATLIFFSIAYLIGTIPSGLIISKLSGYGDIRKIGSGNIGATNVLRTGNKKLALLTLFLDVLKGALIVFITAGLIQGSYGQPFWAVLTYGFLFIEHFSGNIHTSLLFDFIRKSPEELIFMAGLFTVLGHCYPVWLKFKGGKGVATALGVLLAAIPYTGIAACAAWLFIAFAYKISSLAALAAFLVAPIITFIVYTPSQSFICLLISALVYWRHKDNIKRLIKREEPKISFKKQVANDANV